MDIHTNEHWTKSNPLKKNMKAAAVAQNHERQKKRIEER